MDNVDDQIHMNLLEFWTMSQARKSIGLNPKEHVRGTSPIPNLERVEELLHNDS